MELEDFLNFASSQKEISLCLVDKDSIQDHTIFFTNNNFKEAKNILDFLDLISKGGDVFFIPEFADYKNLYDIAVQFPTGQISFFDTTKSDTLWVKPSYDNSRVIVLVNKEDFNGELLVPFGLTYQE